MIKKEDELLWTTDRRWRWTTLSCINRIIFPSHKIGIQGESLLLTLIYNIKCKRQCIAHIWYRFIPLSNPNSVRAFPVYNWRFVSVNEKYSLVCKFNFIYDDKQEKCWIYFYKALPSTSIDRWMGGVATVILMAWCFIFIRLATSYRQVKCKIIMCLPISWTK